MNWDVIENTSLDKLYATLETLGTPIHVMRRYPFWKPIVVDPDRSLGRNGSTGLIGLHIDFVNTQYPPDYVAFYCDQADPNGGGTNLVSVIDGIEGKVGFPYALGEEDRPAVYRPFYRHGEVVDLDHVGDDCSPFPFIDLTAQWKYRYGDGISSCAGAQIIHDYLWHRVNTINLQPGDALIVNQRTTLHGRLPLHGDQAAIPAAQRRRLATAYVRA